MDLFGWDGSGVLLLPRFMPVKLQLTDGVTGNTSDFGSEESRFEPWSVNYKEALLKRGFFMK